MATKFLERAVADLEKATLTPDDTRRILSDAETQNNRVAGLFATRLLQMVIAWGICIGVAARVVSEGSIVGFAFKDLSPILLLGPLVLAALFHDAIGAAIIGTISAEIIEACYRRLYPDAPWSSIDALYVPTSFIEVDMRVPVPGRKGLVPKFLQFTSLALIALMAFGPAAALGHTVWLAFSVAKVPYWLAGCVAAVSLLVFLRAIALLYEAYWAPNT